MEKIANLIYSNSSLSYTDFSEKYMKFTGKSIATAKRVHKSLLELQIIEKHEERYRLIVPEEDDEIESE